MTRQYIGARYVPKIFGDWVENHEFEPLTIVTYLNNSYTSKKTVPATVGNPADNSEYWVCTGNYNAQVEEYRQEVTECTSSVENLTRKVNYLSPEMFGAKGDGVTDDTLAFQRFVNELVNLSDGGVSVGYGYGNYLISNTIEITTPSQNVQWDLFINKLVCTKTNAYAIVMNGIVDSCKLTFNYIEASGGGILAEGTDEITNWLEYCTISGKRMRCGTLPCIKLIGSGNNGFVNNFYIDGIRFQHGLWGIQIVNGGANIVSNCGFEYAGIQIDSAPYCTFLNCRIVEPPESAYLFESVGTCEALGIIGTISMPGATDESDTRFKLSDGTNGYIITQPMSNFSSYATKQSYYMNIVNGTILPSNSDYGIYATSSESAFRTREINNFNVPSFIILSDTTREIMLDKQRYGGLNKINTIYVMGNNTGCDIYLQNKDGSSSDAIFVIPANDDYKLYCIKLFDGKAVTFKLPDSAMFTTH